MVKTHKEQCQFETICCPKNKLCRIMMLRKNVSSHLSEECKVTNVCTYCKADLNFTLSPHLKCINEIIQQVREGKEKVEELKNAIRKSQKIIAENTKRKPKIIKKDPSTGIELVECEYCGRKFSTAMIERHKRMCEKELKISKPANVALEPEKPSSTHEAKIEAFKIPKGDLSEVEEIKELDSNICENCGRKFTKDALEKHKKACNNPQKNLRRVFDSKAQRLGMHITELEKITNSSQGEIRELAQKKEELSNVLLNLNSQLSSLRMAFQQKK